MSVYSCTCMQEDWVLCRVFYKKKADAMDYAMDSDQDVAMPRSADHPSYSPSFPALGSGHYHLPPPPPSDQHAGAGADSLNDFPAAMALLHHQHNSMFNFPAPPHAGGNGRLASAAAAAWSRDGSGAGGDPCAAVGDAAALRPGPGAERLQRLVTSLLSEENFRPRQCVVEEEN